MPAPIKIIITQEGVETTAGGGSGTPSTNYGVDTPQGVATPKQSQVNTLLIDYGKQIMQEGINNYVDFTGNYILSDHLQSGLNAATNIALLAKGGVLGGASVAFNMINQTIRFNREISRKNQQIDFLRTQAGRVVEMGGRYTYD